MSRAQKPVGVFGRRIATFEIALRAERDRLLDEEIPSDLIVRNLAKRHDRLRRIGLALSSIDKLSKAYESPPEDDLHAAPLFDGEGEEDGEESEEVDLEAEEAHAVPR